MGKLGKGKTAVAPGMAEIMRLARSTGDTLAAKELAIRWTAYCMNNGVVR